MHYKKDKILSDFNYNIVVNQLLANGINDIKLLNLFQSLNKEDFLPTHLKSMSSTDIYISLPDNRFVLDNVSLLSMIKLAALKASDKVLVIGSDLGFSLALIAKLSNNVICLEESKSIMEDTLLNLQKSGINNVKLISGKLIEGDVTLAPYNIIFVNGAFKAIPKKWLSALAVKSSVIGALRQDNISNIVKVTLQSNDELLYNYYQHCSVPLLKPLLSHNSFEF